MKAAKTSKHDEPERQRQTRPTTSKHKQTNKNTETHTHKTKQEGTHKTPKNTHTHTHKTDTLLMQPGGRSLVRGRKSRPAKATTTNTKRETKKKKHKHTHSHTHQSLQQSSQSSVWAVQKKNTQGDTKKKKNKTHTHTHKTKNMTHWSHCPGCPVECGAHEWMRRGVQTAAQYMGCTRELPTMVEAACLSGSINTYTSSSQSKSLSPPNSKPYYTSTWTLWGYGNFKKTY